MYGCESWTTRKSECQRINAFELWCWRRLLRVPWRARRLNQSIRKEVNTDCSFKGLMLMLLMWLILWALDVKSWLIGKDPDAGKGWRQKEKGQQRMRQILLPTIDINLSKLQEIVKDRGDWRATVHGVAKSWTQLSDWTTATKGELSLFHWFEPNKTISQ